MTKATAAQQASDAAAQKRWDAATDRILFQQAYGVGSRCLVISQGVHCKELAEIGGNPCLCYQHRDVVLPDWVWTNWNAEGPATSIWWADMALLDAWVAGRLWAEEQSRSSFEEWWHRDNWRFDPRRNLKSGRPSWVYFLVRDDAIKIGRSVNVKERIQSFQQGQSDLLGVIPGGHVVETRWHKTWSHLRIKGEWFRADADLLDAIDEATATFANA